MTALNYERSNAGFVRFSVIDYIQLFRAFRMKLSLFSTQRDKAINGSAAENRASIIRIMEVTRHRDPRTVETPAHGGNVCPARRSVQGLRG
jgi:hypothetical protein